jgi:hypothetical protein
MDVPYSLRNDYLHGWSQWTTRSEAFRLVEQSMGQHSSVSRDRTVMAAQRLRQRILRLKYQQMSVYYWLVSVLKQNNIDRYL